MRSNFFVWCLGVALVLAGACSDETGDGTQVVIEIRAEPALRKKLKRVDVDTYDVSQADPAGKPLRVSGQRFELGPESPSGVTFPFSFGVIKKNADQFLLVVTGFEGDRVVVEHKTRVGFENGKTRRLGIDLSDACYEMLCGEVGSQTWFQTTCDGDQASCGGLAEPEPLVGGDDDEAGVPDSGRGPAADGSTSGGADSGSTRSDAGGDMDAGKDAGNDATSDDTGLPSDGGAADTAPPVDAQPSACGNQTCPATAHCTQTATPLCECNDGFVGNGTTCTNVDDCRSGSCPATSRCVDGVNDFMCSCNAGYFQATSKTCAPHFVSISASGSGDRSGGATNCARRTDGTVSCWGRNGYGQFGNGTSENANPLPVTIDIYETALQLAVGSTFVCAIHPTGSVWCSGRNAAGQLGDGTGTASVVPVQVMGLSDVVEIAAGYEHACARRMNGTVACWGQNDSGQLGNASAGTQSLVPVDVTGLNNAVEIAVGSGHSCARRNDAASPVVCWGSGSSGQLGNGAQNSSPTPVAVSPGGSAGSPVLVNPTGLALGNWHTCALLAGGGVACWGYGSHGELGDGSGNSFMVPVRVMAMTDAVEVAANQFYSCARRSGGTVSCWGQWPGVGVGTPRQIMGITGAAEIAAGYWHTCVRKTDGNVLCWGENNYGVFGNGTAAVEGDAPTITPVQVRAY